jgi:DNA-binding LacI/PurR family transcriptional regulator
MQKHPTLKDIAEALGIHKSTVSLALSGKGTIAAATRERIIVTAKEMGYEPNLLAQRLAQGGVATAVCIASGALDVGIATEKILHIQQELGKRGLEAPLYTAPPDATSEQQVAMIKSLARQRPHAIVCAVQRMESAVFEHLALYQHNGGLVVSYDTAVPYGWDQVTFDREDNAYQAARRLIEAGHRHIGIGISAMRSHAPNDPNTLRLRGFQRALEEAGIPFNNSCLFRNELYEKGGAEMARQFLAMRERPTALAIVNDYVAMAFMTEVLRAGVRIPDELSIIGHDNQPIAAYCPVPLSTMSQPTVEIAEAVVTLLQQRLDGHMQPETISVPSVYVERDSVAPPQERKAKK